MAPADGRIFISYRRQETAWPARQLYEALCERFGVSQVFKDVDNIAPGEDFVEKITSVVGSCRVLLAMIGPQWLHVADNDGNRRVDDPDDFVRLEVATALSRGVLVVPILVDGARMPKSTELPSDLAGLARRQAVEISPTGFNLDRLFRALDDALSQSAVGGPTEVTAPGAASETVAELMEREVVEPELMAPEPTTPGVVESEPVAGEPATPEPDPPASPEPTTPEPAQPKPDPLVAPTQPEVAPPRPGGVPSDTGPLPPTPGPESVGTRNRRLVGVIAGLAVVALVAVALIWRPWQARERSEDSPSLTPTAPSPTTGSTGPVTSLSPTPTPPPADLPEPPVLAHRGGLEHHQFETLQAMEAAARAGFAVETDVRYTKDGVAVLVHDERATKGLDCGGQDVRVSKTTWDELRKLCRSKPTAADPKTYEIPTLDATLEAIAAASPTSWVFLEVKTDLSAKKLRAFLEVPGRYGLSARTVMTSFERERLAAIREADPSFRRMLFISGTPTPASELKADRLWGAAVEQPLATAEYVAELQGGGMKVMVWNPNEPRQWEAAIRTRPDLVMSDYPEKYQEWLQGR